MQNGDGANFATYACKIIPPSPFRTASDIAHFVRSCGLILHFAHFLRSYTSTHLLRDETRGAAAPRKGAPSTRRGCEVVGAL